MLFSGLASVAVGSYAGAPPQAERTQSHRPQGGELLAKPALHVAHSISFSSHIVCVPYNTHALQGFSSRVVSFSPNTKRQATFTQRQLKTGGGQGQKLSRRAWEKRGKEILQVPQLALVPLGGGSSSIENQTTRGMDLLGNLHLELRRTVFLGGCWRRWALSLIVVVTTNDGNRTADSRNHCDTRRLAKCAIVSVPTHKAILPCACLRSLTTRAGCGAPCTYKRALSPCTSIFSLVHSPGTTSA